MPNLKKYLQHDENLAAVLFFNLLQQYTGKAEYKSLAEKAMRYIASESIATENFPGGTLLADYELKNSPMHLTIVGAKKDPSAKELFMAALKKPFFYKRIEWWDRSEGPLLNMDVTYPELKSAAAFVCTQKRCSLPIYKPEKI